jgi:hypothetical protein
MTATCKRCGKEIELRPSGQHFKWFAGKTWRCGNDPAFPVLAHAPAEVVVS